MADPPILILVALEHEARPIRHALRNEQRARIITIGPGASAMPAPHAFSGAELVIVAGLGGGLDPSLRTGDVVIDRRDADSMVRNAGDEPPRLGIEGRIHTAARIVRSPAEKRRLFDQSGAAVVDMEQARVREHLMGLSPSLAEPPLIGVRAVLDAADRTLPPALAEMVDERGRTRAGRAIRVVLGHPAMMPRILEVSRGSRVALARLAACVRALVRTWPVDPGGA